MTRNRIFNDKLFNNKPISLVCLDHARTLPDTARQRPGPGRSHPDPRAHSRERQRATELRRDPRARLVPQDRRRPELRTKAAAAAELELK